MPNVAFDLRLNDELSFRLAQVIIVMFSIAIFFTYAIQFYVPLEILVPFAQAKARQFNVVDKDVTVDFVLRYILILITCK